MQNKFKEKIKHVFVLMMENRSFDHMFADAIFNKAVPPLTLGATHPTVNSTLLIEIMLCRNEESP